MLGYYFKCSKNILKEYLLQASHKQGCKRSQQDRFHAPCSEHLAQAARIDHDVENYSLCTTEVCFSTEQCLEHEV